jgi:hypothetical protein
VKRGANHTQLLPSVKSHPLNSSEKKPWAIAQGFFSLLMGDETDDTNLAETTKLSASISLSAMPVG